MGIGLGLGLFGPQRRQARPPLTPPPVNTVAPVISGATVEGSLLSCTPGTWTGSPTLTYQWRKNGANIGGATANTYTSVHGDIGASITCRVTGTTLGGVVGVTSNAIAVTVMVTYATWNPAVSGGGNFNFSGGNLAVQMSGVAHGSCKSTLGKTAEKHYWEILCGPQSPTASIGVMKSSGDYGTCAGETGSLGAAIAAAIVRANGVPYPGGSVATAAGVVVGVLLDLDLALIDFEIDGVNYGGGPNALGIWYTPGDTIFAACGAFGGNGPLVTANFGATPFAHTVPSGYRAGLYA